MQSSLSVPASPARIRVLFVLGAALVVFLYVAFVAAHIVFLYRMGSQQEVLAGSHQLPQKDFGLFWCAGNGLLSQVAARFHFTVSEAYRQICQNDILSQNSPVEQAWPYPPTMGLLVVPFALLPLQAGFWIWRAFCVLASVALLRLARLDWRVIGLGLAGPAALHDFTNGQNGTLTGSILLASLLLAKDRPRLAGLCAGVLTIKPHLGFPIVVAAIRLRAWRLVGYAAAVALLLIALASLLWGKAGWMWFFGTAQHDEWLWTARPFKRAFPGAGITVYYMARNVGLSDHQALIAQLISAAAALFLIWQVWKPGAMATLPKVIITICLNVWVVPHGYMYDLVAFSTAMGVIIVQVPGWRRFVACLTWLMAGYTGAISLLITHFLCFPLIAAAGAALAWSARHELAMPEAVRPRRRATSFI